MGERSARNEELKLRTMRFGLDVFRLCQSIEDKDAKFTVVRQLIRSSSSIGANYRAACRAKSRADFINKLKIVEEEADESLYWIEFLTQLGFISKAESEASIREGTELLKIVVASIQTARASDSP